MQNENKYQIAVIGGGLAGLTVALALGDICAARNAKLALVARREGQPDGRTTAMLMPTVKMLETMGIWQEIEADTEALKTMRLIDGSRRLIRAPIADFKASELGIDAFGYNVPNEKMKAVLLQRIKDHKAIQLYDSAVSSVEHSGDVVRIPLDDGVALETSLAVAADGRNSILRAAAGIEIRSWSYPQTAIVLTFKHSLSHNGVSAEFHTETGPFTQVPLPPKEGAPNRSSLVWVVAPADADELLSLDIEQISQDIETKMQSCFGKVEVEAPPQTFPLSGLTARRFAANRTVLIGEAAHVFPPIGAQGFNLGVRDIKALTVLVGEALESGEDLGSQGLMDDYHGARISDVTLRTGAVDMLNRSLLADFLPVQAARAIGLSAVSSIPSLRRFMMRQGLGAGIGS